MYTLTFNFLNQTSIIGFHLGFLKIGLHLNKGISIDDFSTNVIVRTTSTFVNLKFYLFIEINYSRIIHCCLFFYHVRK